MIAKMLSDTELSLPRQAVEALGHPSHFDVQVEAGRLILVPSGNRPADIVRRKLDVWDWVLATLPRQSPGLAARIDRGAQVRRAVFDTNIVVSALVFSGRLAWLRTAWTQGNMTPVTCRETVDELLRVLSSPSSS